MSQVHFRDMHAEPPLLDQITKEYGAIEAALEFGPNGHASVEALRRWDELRRQLQTWRALTHIRFNQDTRHEEHRRAREHCDELWPRLAELEVALMRKLVRPPWRQELEQRHGSHLLALWDEEIAAFDPAIKQDLVQEAQLCAEYTEALAGARFEFQGQSLSLSGLAKFIEDPRRDVRRQAVELRAAWFADNAETLDRIFDDLVRLRTQMAHKLAYPSYVEMGYRRMLRFGYGRPEVEAYRKALLREVLPLCLDIRRRQAEALDLEQLMIWDLEVYDTSGNPAPRGDHDWILGRAVELFAGLGGELDELFRLMLGRGLLDLEPREGKASGGYCASLFTHGVPFIFGSFRGTKGDVELLIHEMGHAFQAWLSRELYPFEYLWPTLEACEIHSTTLEYFTRPAMEGFFGEEAERFRQLHLVDAIVRLPYGLAVDHFQHRVYDLPEATPAERHAMWRELEREYLPWRDHGGIPHLEAGGSWQGQVHIYQSPFYYIDYSLAQIVALQFLSRFKRDSQDAMRAYVELCRRGGQAPFLDLVRGAGLESPFEPECLAAVVAAARQELRAWRGP